MAWDTLKESLMTELVQRIDNRAEPADVGTLAAKCTLLGVDSRNWFFDGFSIRDLGL